MKKQAVDLLIGNHWLSVMEEGWVVTLDLGPDSAEELGTYDTVLGALNAIYEDRIRYSGAKTLAELQRAMHLAGTLTLEGLVPLAACGLGFVERSRRNG